MGVTSKKVNVETCFSLIPPPRSASLGDTMCGLLGGRWRVGMDAGKHPKREESS